MIRSRANLRAFTLVEVMASMVLSALLMITVLMVVGSFGRERKAIASRSKAETPDNLVALLRWDLLNARTVQLGDHSMRLAGFGSLDPRTLAPAALRPVEVEYVVQQLGGRAWLVRRQWEPGASRPASTELVSPGVSDIAAIPLNLDTGHLVAISNGAMTKSAMPLTAQVRLKIAFDSAAIPPIDELLVRQ